MAIDEGKRHVYTGSGGPGGREVLRHTPCRPKSEKTWDVQHHERPR